MLVILRFKTLVSVNKTDPFSCLRWCCCRHQQLHPSAVLVMHSVFAHAVLTGICQFIGGGEISAFIQSIDQQL